MYDIEFVVNAFNSSPFDERMMRFIDRGLLNIKDRKVLVRFLVGRKKFDLPKLPYDFTQETDESDDVVTKTFNHFGNRKVGQKARWIAKFDDDSSTDVDGLVRNLDEYYDCEIPTYVTNEEIRSDIASWDRLNLENHNLKPFLGSGVKLFHEIEGCVLSSPCLDRILRSELCKSLLRKRATIADSNVCNWNDQHLGFASKIVKVTPVGAHFMSHRPLIADFSMKRGRFNHIHNLCYDKNRFDCEFFDKLIDGEIDKNFNGRYHLSNGGHKNSVIILEDGTINHDSSEKSYRHGGAYVPMDDDNVYLINFGDPPMMLRRIDGEFYSGNYSLKRAL